MSVKRNVTADESRARPWQCICTSGKRRSKASLDANGRSRRSSPTCSLKGGWLSVAERTALPCANVTAHRRGFSTATDAVSETKPAQVIRDSLALFMNAYPAQTGTQFKKKKKKVSMGGQTDKDSIV